VGAKRTTAPAKIEGYESLTRLPKIQNIEIRGCTNEDEANRHARFRINKNEFITMQGKHKAGMQSAGIEFGEVFTLIPTSHKAVWGGNLRKDHVAESDIYLNGEVNFSNSGEALHLFAVGSSGEYKSYQMTGPWDESTSIIQISGEHTGNRGDAVGIGREVENKLTQQVLKVSHNFSNREVSFEWCEYSDRVFYCDLWDAGEVAI